jgi:hypothetical protein
MATYGDKIIISGFGDENTNGNYDYIGDYNSYAAYQKGNFFILYYSQNMPWSMAEGYYIAEKKQIQGSIPILKPLYKLASNNASAITGWTSLMDATSGENTSGTTVFDEESSSSSIDSSSSSSSTSNSSSSSSSTSNSSSSSSSTSNSSSSSSSSSTSNGSSSSSSIDDV